MSQASTKKLEVAVVSVFAIWPSIHFVGANLELGVNPGPILIVGFITIILALCLYFIVSKTLLGPVKSAALAATTVFTFFGVQLSREFVQFLELDGGIISFWLIYSAILIVLSLMVNSYKRLSGMLTIGLVGVTVALLPILVDVTNLNLPQDKSQAVEKHHNFSKFVKRVDVYYLLVDTYLRNDVIKEISGFDNSVFVEALGKRGFAFVPSARSNYQLTKLSMPSTLMKRYLVTEGNAEFRSVREAGQLLKSGQGAFKFFKAANYQVITLGSMFCSKVSDYCINQGLYIHNDIITFLYSTPLPVIASYILPDSYLEILSTKDGDLKHFHKRLSRLGERKGEQQFVFAYTSELHDKVFNAKCELRPSLAIEHIQRMGFDDRQNRSIEAYTESLKCTNKRLIKIVDLIIKRSPSSIIVIASDHGTQFTAREGKKPSPKEKFSVFSAWRLPEGCRENILPDLTNVNHFRLIESCLTGREFEPLENRFYIGNYEELAREGKLRRYFFDK